MTILSTLTTARRLIERPQMWTRGLLATDSLGNATQVDASDASCFCIYGALQRAAGGSSGLDYFGAVKFISEAVPYQFAGCIAVYNDDPNTLHGDVLAVLDRAIHAACKASERVAA